MRSMSWMRHRSGLARGGTELVSTGSANEGWERRLRTEDTVPSLITQSGSFGSALGIDQLFLEPPGRAAVWPPGAMASVRRRCVQTRCDISVRGAEELLHWQC